ncbi:hypothetical protein K402DRAFT_418837 [Aulographum hederae CBS 113979]|uniref:Uncharacterized protein n=1 Tax=Aulographum hederae CBS 113979 TaxID=1176131 RepID=A0A6G1H7G1_9PEZI|nr:hypothetical protein K402DRAFT_418837 [Aulographum hederae CBS 113979]
MDSSRSRNDTGGYRQTVFVDDQSVSVFESLRPTHDAAMSSVQSQTPVRSCVPLHHEDQCINDPVPGHFAPDPKTSSLLADPYARGRVLAKKYPVVIFQSKNTRDDGESVQAELDRTGKQGILTPPPTPRLSRLPSPDLKPVRSERFCDCCQRTVHGKNSRKRCDSLQAL